MNRNRPKQIVIRVSEEELQKIKKKVEASGMSQQEYLIKAILDKKVTNTDGIKEILPQLGKVGSNLNQVARKLNESGYVDYKNELPKAIEGCNEIWQLLKQYLQKQV